MAMKPVGSFPEAGQGFRRTTPSRFELTLAGEIDKEKGSLSAMHLMRTLLTLIQSCPWRQSHSN